MAYEFWRWGQSPTGFIVSCTTESISSPFQSPCLYGSTMFLGAWLSVDLIVRARRRWSGHPNDLLRRIASDHHRGRAYPKLPCFLSGLRSTARPDRIITTYLRIRGLLPLIEDLRQIEVRRDQTDVAVSLQDSHHTRRHAIDHVARLRDGRNEMVVFRRQE